MLLQLGIFIGGMHWLGLNTKLLLVFWFATCFILLAAVSFMITRWIIKPARSVRQHIQLLLEDDNYNKQLNLKNTGPFGKISEALDALVQKNLERELVATKHAYDKGAATLGAAILDDAKVIVQPISDSVLVVEQQLQNLPVSELDMLGVGRKIREQQRVAIVKISGIRSRLARIITVIRKHTSRLNIN